MRVRQGSGGDLIIIVVYVDDILVVSRNSKKMREFKDDLAERFAIKDLGEVGCCLEIEFLKRRDGYTIHQRGQIEEVLRRFGMTECKPASTSMVVNNKLAKDEEPSNSSDRVPYRELVGSLMYLAMGTRPDITHAVSWLSQFNDRHQNENWVAAKRILRYLQGTKDTGIAYYAADFKLTGLVDADWGNCPGDRRSYTGYAFILANGTITWESRKQKRLHSLPRKPSIWGW